MNAWGTVIRAGLTLGVTVVRVGAELAAYILVAFFDIGVGFALFNINICSDMIIYIYMLLTYY